MKLKENQLKLLRHLAKFESLEYPSCLKILDNEKKNDIKALSYSFRPLTKNKYVKKYNDGKVNILVKGRALFPQITPLVTTGGGELGAKRINTVSRTAMLLKETGIESYAEPINTEQPCFIPSACWRKIRPGILSTTRFTGMLIFGEHRLAVYDIGDGTMEWQLRAERSLFYYSGDYRTQATGMLMICDDDKRDDIAEKIIRLTMWSRRHLIDSKSSHERDRPVKYVHAPIRLAQYYEHVYLTTPETLRSSIKAISEEEHDIKMLRKNAAELPDPLQGDYEDWPYRFFVNFTTDLLKYVYYFSAAKSLMDLREKDITSASHIHELNYALFVPEKDYPIVRIYPDVIDMEGMEFYDYQSNRNN